MAFVYLASPYSHPDEQVRKDRYHAVCRAAGKLMRNAFVVFCPIAHSCAIAVHGEAPLTDWAFWRRQDFELLRRAEVMWILELEGWRESVGVRAEIELCRAIDIPVLVWDGTGMELGKGLKMYVEEAA